MKRGEIYYANLSPTIGYEIDKRHCRVLGFYHSAITGIQIIRLTESDSSPIAETLESSTFPPHLFAFPQIP